jgi:uncharacterized protein
MNNITRYFDVELRTKQEEDREVEGYAVVFNATTDLGWFTEEIDKDAFNECDMSDVYLLFNHDENNVLAGTANGSLQLKIDERGLFQTSKIIDTSTGEDIFKLVKNGLIKKMSFGFSIDGNGGEEWISNEKKDHRIIKKINKLFDVSLVTYPAYNQTSAYARNLNDDLANEYKRRKEQDKKMEELWKKKS